MNAILLILLSFALSFGCSYITMPTDFSTVASGTRANLAANFSETENKFNPCADSVAQVRARLSNYTTSLTVTSLENLRLRVDGDATATGIFLVEGSSGDSLFRISENLNARLFGHVAIDSNLTVRKVTAADTVVAANLKSGGSLTLTGNATVAKLTASDSVLAATLNVSGLTASRLMSTNSGKTATSVSDLTSWIAGTANQITSTSDGDGTLTLSLPQNIHTGASPTFAGLNLSANLITTAAVVLNSTTPGNRTIGWQTAGSDRWGLTVGSTAESGSNAGSNLLLRAFTDAGAVIDTPFTITRAAGGTYAIRRPVTMSSTLGVTGLATLSGGALFDVSQSSAQGKIYYNSSDGLTLRGRTGSGNDFILYSADAGSLILNPTGTRNLTIGNSGGTVTVTPAATFTAAPVFSSVTASQFLLVDGSKALTSVAGTGSGSVVRATSPTLVTPVLGAATGTSLNLSGNLTADSIVSAKVYAEGSFTGTLTGVTGTVTGTIRYVRIFKQVTIMIPQIIGTSNSTEATITGMPAGIRPARPVGFIANLMDNTAYSDGSTDMIRIETTGTITLIWNAADDGFTASGFKGFVGQAYIDGSTDNVQAFTYTLQ